MENYARDHGIKHFLFCGDMFHTHQTIHAEPMRIATLMLERWRKDDFKGIFLVGNHDMANRSGGIHSLDFIKGYGHHVVDINTTSTHLTWGQIFHCLPYMDSTREEDVEGFLAAAPPNAIVMMHQGVKNVGVGSKSFILKDEIFDVTKVPDDVFHVFTGHYHSHKHVSNKVTIVGSPMQHTWTDLGERRGFLHVKVDPKEIKFVELEHAPRFQRVDMGSSACFSNDDTLLRNNFVRITNVAEGASISDLRAQAHKLGARSIEFELPQMRTLETQAVSSELFNMPELAVKFMIENELEEELSKTGKDLMSGTYAYAAPED